jgi:heptosyltransferase-2
MGSRGLLAAGGRLFFGRKEVPPRELEAAWRSAQRIVVAALSGIGDSVMATPLIDAVRSARPDADLLILVRPEFAPLIAVEGPSTTIVPIKLSDRSSLLHALGIARRARAHFLFAAQPFNTLKHSLLTIASGSAHRLKTARSYQGEEWRDFSFLYSALPPDTPGRHRIELNLDQLRAVGVSVPEGSFRPRVRVSEEARSKAASLLPESGHARVVGVHPGGLYAHKHWGVERFAEACRLIAASGDVAFAMIGSGPELAACAEIRALTPELAWTDLAGRSDLPTTAALLERIDLLLSNDTGVMHLATAVDRPVVAVFGSTDPRRIGPYHQEARWIRRDPITTIAPEEVATLVIDRLRELGSRRAR